MKKWTALVPAALMCAPAFAQLQLPSLSTQQLGGTLNQTLANPLGGTIDAARATTGSVTSGAGLPVQPAIPTVEPGRTGVAGLQPVNGLERTRLDASGSQRGSLTASGRGGTQAMQAFRIGDRVFIAPDLESARAMAGIDSRAGADASAGVGPGRRAALRASQQGSLTVRERAALNVPGSRLDQQGVVAVDQRAGAEVSDRTARQTGQSAAAQARDAVRSTQRTGARAVGQARDRANNAKDSVSGRLQPVNEARDRAQDRARTLAGQTQSRAVDRAADRLPLAEDTLTAVRH